MSARYGTFSDADYVVWCEDCTTNERWPFLVGADEVDLHDAWHNERAAAATDRAVERAKNPYRSNPHTCLADTTGRPAYLVADECEPCTYAASDLMGDRFVETQEREAEAARRRPATSSDPLDRKLARVNRMHAEGRIDGAELRRMRDAIAKVRAELADEAGA